jgi:hypothetical protein
MEWNENYTPKKWCEEVQGRIDANAEAVAELKERRKARGAIIGKLMKKVAKVESRLNALEGDVKELQDEANTHLYWTPSEIEAARHKARELMKHFDNLEAPSEPEKGAWICPQCGSDLGDGRNLLVIAKRKYCPKCDKCVAIWIPEPEKADKGLIYEHAPNCGCLACKPTKPDKKKCPKCKSENVGREDRNRWCRMCGHRWSVERPSELYQRY